MALIKVSDVLDLFPSIKEFFNKAECDYMPEKFSADDQPNSEYLLGSHIIMQVLMGDARIELEPDLVDKMAMRLKVDNHLDEEGMADYMKTSQKWKELFKE
jgi:hypothetical protein